MNILGIDLGTNSIGWAIRNPTLKGNQIEKFGVITFNKGVGLGKTGEYSYAAERTRKRSARRLYQSRKYRLWTTLEHLIAEGYCPLTIENLNKWRHYDKEEAIKNNNAGRVYPIGDLAFDAWIKLDFNVDGKPDYTSPYQLRKELADTKLDFTKEENRFKLGRALYHIAQRRGFKSSRKSAEDTKDSVSGDSEVLDLQYSEKKKNRVIAELFEKYKEARTLGWLFALLEENKIRIRESVAQYAIRENYKEEIKYIFQLQEISFDHPLYTKLVESGRNRNNGSIFYKRPLRSQKGLVGKCTLEPNKYRAPISHPAFEAFRAWAFLNNIKYKEITDKNSDWKPLTLELKRDIYEDKFFRKSKAYFPFLEIEEFIKTRKKGWMLNYKPKTTVMGCPVSARLKDIFGDDYLNIKIPKAKAAKSDKSNYDIEDVWHVLFNYEDQECVSAFAEQKLKLDSEKVKQFVIAWNALPVGYGMLSINAINKINKFLEKGLIYTEAVLLANIPDIIGEKLWMDNESFFSQNISNVIEENRQQKTILNIVNTLVSKYKNLEPNERFGVKDDSYKLDDSDYNEISLSIEEHYGANRWNEFEEDKKQTIFDNIKDCYQAYFNVSGLKRKDINGKRHFEVHSNGKVYYKTDSGYYRLPKLIDTLSEFLRVKFNVEEKSLQKIYHPSEINIYPPAKPVNGVIKLGSPQTGSFKNPMAMRALHELRKLINFLIETNQINDETRVVVEVARELNDANKRWAIEAWQRQREAENQEFAKAIEQLLSEERGIIADPKNDSDIDKIRLFYEQNNEHTLPPVIERENGKTKSIRNNVKDESVRWNGSGKKLIDKYRLWKEQGYRCIYTGRFITIVDLFKEGVIDFEHTIPRSKSFDNSLANLTVCYHDYNRTIKQNKIPTQLENYDSVYDYGPNIGVCTAILPRLDTWKEKVERIKQQIDFWTAKSKRAVDKQWKDDAIKQRHLWKMELDYWQNKLDRFTITEITTGFKNSQKVDTQLISKYAFHYLKTYFEKVDVQKGSITAEFRKIYKLQSPKEKKDRGKHSHHAKDAVILSLIPSAAKRDLILEKYYEAKEKNLPFTETEPFKGFRREFVSGIDETVLINNIIKNQSLTPAKRKVRKRGKEQYSPQTNNPMWATGDTVRGQLHQETFFGAIKPAKRGEKGNLLMDENKKFIQEEKERYVIRIPFQFKKDANTPGFKTMEEIKQQIVDEGLKKQIEKQVNDIGGLKEAFEKGLYLLDKNGRPHGNKIRHIRVWANVSEPLKIKRQTNVSKAEYKQYYWAANATNSYFALYIGEDKKEFDFRNLFETAKITSLNTVKNPKELFPPVISIVKGKKAIELPLVYVLEAGTKVFFRKDKNEDLSILSNNELSKRLYVYTNFEKDGRLNFKYHLEARNKIEEAYKDSEIDFDNPKPTLRFGYAKYSFLVEGCDFRIEMDGTIKWKDLRATQD